MFYSQLKNLKKYQKDWYDENAPLGKELGYPECCIQAFCDQPPQLLKIRGTNNDDRLRYKSGCIDGKFTGLIPCITHAKQILKGEITLDSLVNKEKRNKEFGIFPYYANFNF